jgi:hypothetical protein
LLPVNKLTIKAKADYKKAALTTASSFVTKLNLNQNPR